VSDPRTGLLRRKGSVRFFMLSYRSVFILLPSTPGAAYADL
jgi:hypothetical protein